ncbi:hypothetical protein [Caulobacter sp. DWP3-1-3b2]|uniref:hypothetical protein n=1 Tax=Caulobacter sp. DWP3-1-3b2 TaxID=2804643 RepID=UPI003CE9A220
MFLAAAGFAAALNQADAVAGAAPIAELSSRICSAPTPPQTIRPTLPPIPKLPSCVNEAKGTHTCRKGELDRYNASMKVRNRAMDEFIGAVNGYTGLLNQYTLAANEYARCEISEIRKADE